MARALARAGREVLLLEKERWIGQDTSSRNSEVIHAGLYYPEGSLKARFCVEGRQKLYAYCAERDVPHKRIGKLVVGVSDDEIATLKRVIKHAEAAGVTDLEWLDGKDARAMEPALNCVAAFHSPSTGIIDSHALMQAYQTDAENAGASVVLRAPVLEGRVTRDGFTLEIGGSERMTLDCKLLINSAGLYAPSLARRIAGIPAATIPPDYYCRGVYFTLAGRAPFKRLVYPVPEHAGLGVHLTLDMAARRASVPIPNGSMASTTRSTRGAATSSMRRSAPIGPASPMGRCSRAMPASVPRSAARKSRRRIS